MPALGQEAGSDAVCRCCYHSGEAMRHTYGALHRTLRLRLDWSSCERSSYCALGVTSKDYVNCNCRDSLAGGKLRGGAEADSMAGGERAGWFAGGGFGNRNVRELLAQTAVVAGPARYCCH